MFVMLLSTWAAGSFRLGLEFGDPNAVLIVRLNPIDIKVGYSVQGIFSPGEANFLHISADYRIIQTHLIEFLNIYLGIGAYAQVFTGGGGNFNLGGRIPVGINVYMLKNVVEIFFEVVPTIRFWSELGFGGFQGYLGFTIAMP